MNSIINYKKNVDAVDIVSLKLQLIRLQALSKSSTFAPIELQNTEHSEH